jgi:hypothetical protein
MIHFIYLEEVEDKILPKSGSRLRAQSVISSPSIPFARIEADFPGVKIPAAAWPPAWAVDPSVKGLLTSRGFSREFRPRAG